MRVLVIGGTGTIGSAVAGLLATRDDVVVGSRHGPDVVVDITDTDSIRRMFDSLGSVEAVVCAAGAAAFKSLDDLSDDDYEYGFGNKLMGQVNVVRVGHRFLVDGGSFTLTSGKLGHQPMVGTCSISTINSGIEGFIRAAALELPRGIRVNAVSPEWTTETLTLYGMDSSVGVPVAQVAAAYREAVEGVMTGVVIDVGWRYHAHLEHRRMGRVDHESVAI